MTLSYDIATLTPYINWAYFYFAWQVKTPDGQQRLRTEAETFLCAVQGRYGARGRFLIVDCHADGDDVVVDEPHGRIAMLRQQREAPCLCLADFVSPRADRMGLFAVTVDAGMEHDFDHDPYQKMMAQLLADRLAEAAAERMHEEVRKHYWGYAADEQLSIAEMQQEHFQGIRPAVGYPSLPDVSLNFVLDRLLHFDELGITLTESGAMRPHASISGLMIAHPRARYFSVGKIGADQLRDYARRRGLPMETVSKFLASNL